MRHEIKLFIFRPFSNNEHYEVNKDQRPDFGKENSVYSVTSVSEI